MPTAEHSPKQPGRTGRVDWQRVRATTENEIARQIAADPDTAPEMTEEALDRAVIVGPGGKRSPYRHRVERHTDQCLAPGTKAPTSGQYDIIGPRGGRTGEERTVMKGEPLPPTPSIGTTLSAGASRPAPYRRLKPASPARVRSRSRLTPQR
jgi:hypothetical protein